jgi:uncharacterized membrane protein YjdF
MMETQSLTIDRPAGHRITGVEILLVGVAALAGLTGLLLKLPYRAPLVNSLLTVAGLAAVYSYLRFRLEILVPTGILIGLALCVAMDIIGNQFGLFSIRVAWIPYDLITHFTISGVSFFLVMWLLMTVIEKFSYSMPLGFIAFFSATITFSLSAYYEITELMDERWLGGHRIWNTRDTSQDLAADLLGVVVAAVIYTLAVRKRFRNSRADRLTLMN